MGFQDYNVGPTKRRNQWDFTLALMS
jgi:hypothetical protein